MGEQIKLRISLRGHVLAEAATAEAEGDHLHVSMRCPPPVHAVVDAHDGSQSRAMRVTRVVESSADPESGGFHGEYTEERAGTVGSEALSVAAPDVADVAQAVSHAESGPESALPVPAPVLQPEPSEAIDLRQNPEAALPESQAADGSGGSTESEAAAESESPAASTPASASDAGEPEKAGRKGKKRKGRKRG